MLRRADEDLFVGQSSFQCHSYLVLLHSNKDYFAFPGKEMNLGIPRKSPTVSCCTRSASLPMSSAAKVHSWGNRSTGYWEAFGQGFGDWGHCLCGYQSVE